VSRTGASQRDLDRVGFREYYAGQVNADENEGTTALTEKPSAGREGAVSEEFEKTPEIDPNRKENDTFYIKLPQGPRIGSADALRTEKELLERLRLQGSKGETLKPLAIFYSRVGKQETAYQYLKTWMKATRNPEELAECLMMCGQLAEQVEQPKAAIAFYREGLELKPQSPAVNYSLNNNLGYCLNIQAEYEQARRHCKAAIELDPSRSNAFKNLGQSLVGLGRYAEAAESWLLALHTDVSDDRSLGLLENLLTAHKGAVLTEIPDIDKKVEECRHAVTSARGGRFADWSRGLTFN